MKKSLVVLAVISLTGGAAFAQKVLPETQDIQFTAGVRIPIDKYGGSASGEIMSLTYGRNLGKGFGARGGVQWMFENMDIEDYLGIPLSVSWSSGRRTFKQSLESGLENALYSSYHDKYYYNSDPDNGTVIGSFFTGLFNRFEFFAGLTPGYIFGPKETSHGESSSGGSGMTTEHYSYIKNRLCLTADAGLGLSLNVWRFKLSIIPSFHYYITDNYREVRIKRHTHDGSTDVSTSDKARSWQFAIQGGLSFSF